MDYPINLDFDDKNIFTPSYSLQVSLIFLRIDINVYTSNGVLISTGTYMGWIV